MDPSVVIFGTAALLLAVLLYSVKQNVSPAKYLLFLWGLVCFLYAGFVLVSAQSAIHEIQGGVALLIGTIACGLAFVIDGLEELRKAQPKE